MSFRLKNADPNKSNYLCINIKLVLIYKNNNHSNINNNNKSNNNKSNNNISNTNERVIFLMKSKFNSSFPNLDAFIS